MTHSFWVTVAHGECEQVLQIIVCHCYLKLFARTRECFARACCPCILNKNLLNPQDPIPEREPHASPAVGLQASLGRSHHGNGERHRSFLITNVYDTTSLYGYHSKFHKWCLSREWHLSIIPLWTKLFFVCISETAVCSIYDWAKWKTGNRKLRYNHTTPQSWSERNLVDVSQVLKCIFYFLALWFWRSVL